MSRSNCPSDVVDWEVELVVVIGVRGTPASHQPTAWDHVAGVTIGQDLSERVVQMVGTKPQFSLGKSFPGFGPDRPVARHPRRAAARDDLAI